MEARELVRTLHAQAHQIMSAAIAGCEGDTVTRAPEGSTINPIGATYAHSIFDEDMVVNAVVRGIAPVFVRNGWGAKTGLSMPDSPFQTTEWARSVNVDLEAFKSYAAEVQAETASYLQSASDAELAKEVQSPFGPQAALAFIAFIGVIHLSGHQGEIAALKGVAGLKGLPF